MVSIPSRTIERNPSQRLVTCEAIGSWPHDHACPGSRSYWLCFPPCLPQSFERCRVSQLPTMRGTYPCYSNIAVTCRRFTRFEWPFPDSYCLITGSASQQWFTTSCASVFGIYYRWWWLKADLVAFKVLFGRLLPRFRQEVQHFPPQFHQFIKIHRGEELRQPRPKIRKRRPGGAGSWAGWCPRLRKQIQENRDWSELKSWRWSFKFPGK